MARRTSRQRYQLRLGRNTLIRQAVREQHDAVGPFDERCLHVLSSLQPAAREVGSPARLHAGNGLSRRLVAGARWSEDRGDLIVEYRDGKAIILTEQLDETHGSSLGRLEWRP